MRRTETFGFQGIATILVLTSKGTWNGVTKSVDERVGYSRVIDLEEVAS